ncbi:class I SAM-dependent methyltransferase [Demequina rhizosphaerae]|uniref:class I SAM-dependent methyltransferase n=1 Tax=Demequina rhizosphaerae TaxID=1638985 RepID=UPI000783E797|nr:class I SAM-dependent methyltransferase [Demequina rhizosphaerae]
MRTAAATGPLEVLDVLWDCALPSGERIPVRRDDARGLLAERGQHRGARLVDALPAREDGTLDEDAVDQVLLAVHLELARLSEFVHVPQAMAHSLAPIIARLRDRAGGTIRVVDVGCGLGFDTRVLAASGALGADVEFVGLDLNALLVDAADRLARAESIDVRFLHGDALDPCLAIEDPDRTLMISSGLLHHLGRDALPAFFARHAELGVAGFAHFDPSPGFWTDVGAWTLHRTRMREPISRHDGAVSMRRALPSRDLLAVAREGAGDAFDLACDEVPRLYPQPDRIVRPVVGHRR